MSGGGRPMAGGAGRQGGKPAAKPKRPAKQADRASSGRRASAREIALDTLVKIAEAGAYSNLQLNRSLQEAQLSRQDAALATELVYGTIQRQRSLDYRLGELVAKGMDKLAPWVHQLLRMSAYQLLYLDRIPAHAAVNEAVQIAKRRGHAGISGMVNGVLRNMERRLAEMKGPVSEADPVRRIAIAHSYPDWLVRRWLEQYGERRTESICAAGNEPPHASIRVNRLRLSASKAAELLAEQGVAASRSPVAPDGLIVTGGGNLAQSEEFAQGLYSLQDESSMLVAAVCAPRPGMRVLDCCAAPGGKTTHLAELMDDEGEIAASDIHPHKVKLIAEQAQRLGLRSVKAAQCDAAELSSRYEPGSFDLVLLDAPCSGFGVIRRKPEIKWTKTEEDVQAIARLQRRLLDEAARMVKPGGTLVYSTCTIEREENEAQVAGFLERNRQFAPDSDWPAGIVDTLRERGVIGAGFEGMAQLLPDDFGSDGFFIARMRSSAAEE